MSEATSTTVATVTLPSAHDVIVNASKEAAEHYRAAQGLKSDAAQAKRRAEGDRVMALAVGTLSRYPEGMLTQEAQSFLAEHSPKLAALVTFAEHVEETIAAQHKRVSSQRDALQAAMYTTAYTLVERLKIKVSKDLETEWSKSQPELSRMIAAGRHALALGATSDKQLLRLKSIVSKPERYGSADTVREVVAQIAATEKPSFAAFEKELRDRAAREAAAKSKDKLGHVGTDTPAPPAPPAESETDILTWAATTATELTAVMVKINKAQSILPDHAKVTGVEITRNLATVLAAYVERVSPNTPADKRPAKKAAPAAK